MAFGLKQAQRNCSMPPHKRAILHAGLFHVAKKNDDQFGKSNSF